MYAAVEAIARDANWALTPVCDALAVCRSAFYSWRDGEPSPREREATRLRARDGDLLAA